MTTTIDRRIHGGSDRHRASRPGTITVTQYSRRGILAIWAAAALPMGVLAWIVVPALAGGGASLTRALIIAMTAGLIWQFVLVVGLVGYEQRSLRWSRLGGTVATVATQPPHRTSGRTDVARRHPTGGGTGGRGVASGNAARGKPGSGRVPVI